MLDWPPVAEIPGHEHWGQENNIDTPNTSSAAIPATVKLSHHPCCSIIAGNYPLNGPVQKLGNCNAKLSTEYLLGHAKNQQ